MLVALGGGICHSSFVVSPDLQYVDSLIGMAKFFEYQDVICDDFLCRLLCLGTHVQRRVYGSQFVCLSFCLFVTGMAASPVNFK